MEGGKRFELLATLLLREAAHLHLLRLLRKLGSGLLERRSNAIPIFSLADDNYSPVIDARSVHQRSRSMKPVFTEASLQTIKDQEGRGVGCGLEQFRSEEETSEPQPPM